MIKVETYKHKPNYDYSLKEYEVQCVRYSFVTSTRELFNRPYWGHEKYYNTIEQATDAIRDLRRSWVNDAYYHYPPLGREHIYPSFTPTTNIYRYRIVKRNIMKDLFKKQLETTTEVTQEILDKITINYYNGEKIQLGDKVLFGLMMIEPDSNTVIQLNERHFDNFIAVHSEPEGFPTIKLK